MSTHFLRFVQLTIVQNANAPFLSNASSLGSCCKCLGFPFWRTSLDEGLRQQKLWRHWVLMFLRPSKLGVRLREADHFHLFSMEEMQSIFVYICNHIRYLCGSIWDTVHLDSGVVGLGFSSTWTSIKVMKGSYWIISNRFPCMFSDFEGFWRNWNVHCPLQPIATPAVSLSSLDHFLWGLWAFALRRWGASHLCRIHGRNDDSARIKPNHGQGQSRKSYGRDGFAAGLKIVETRPFYAILLLTWCHQFACCSVGHLQLSSKLLDITLAGCTPPISASCQNEDRPRAATPCERRSVWACLQWFKPAMGCVEYEFFRNGKVGSKLAIFFQSLLKRNTHPSCFIGGFHCVSIYHFFGGSQIQQGFHSSKVKGWPSTACRMWNEAFDIQGHPEWLRWHSLRGSQLSDRIVWTKFRLTSRSARSISFFHRRDAMDWRFHDLLHPMAIVCHGRPWPLGNSNMVNNLFHQI